MGLSSVYTETFRRFLNRSPRCRLLTPTGRYNQLRSVVPTVLNQVLDAEISDFLSAVATFRTAALFTQGCTKTGGGRCQVRA